MSLALHISIYHGFSDSVTDIPEFDIRRNIARQRTKVYFIVPMVTTKGLAFEASFTYELVHSYS